MAELRCVVATCTYNKNSLCCKGDIMVGGSSATTSSETSCDSFRERKEDSYTSSLEHPSKVISIDCEAVKCVYNSNYKCKAEHVDIRGGGANSAQGTQCHTFREK